MPSMNGVITLRERVKRQDTLSVIANNDFQYYLAKLSWSLALHSESPWFYIVLLIQDSVSAEKNMNTLFSPTLSKYHSGSIRTLIKLEAIYNVYSEKQLKDIKFF